jgi:cytochrome o ubiquinol oxidase subunit 2
MVPQLGSQIYTMPGMTTRLNLRADEPGLCLDFSAQFSGDGFSDMRFELDAVPANQFAAWLEGTKTQGPALDTAAYDALAHPSKAVALMTLARVTSGFFETILVDRASADRLSHRKG